jgi:hypothetical protein
MAFRKSGSQQLCILGDEVTNAAASAAVGPLACGSPAGFDPAGSDACSQAESNRANTSSETGFRILSMEHPQMCVRSMTGKAIR